MNFREWYETGIRCDAPVNVGIKCFWEFDGHWMVEENELEPGENLSKRFRVDHENMIDEYHSATLSRAARWLWDECAYYEYNV